MVLPSFWDPQEIMEGTEGEPGGEDLEAAHCPAWSDDGKTWVSSIMKLWTAKGVEGGARRRAFLAILVLGPSGLFPCFPPPYFQDDSSLSGMILQASETS